MELLKPQANVTPICPYFYQCGGCDSQDIKYSDQVAYKENWLRSLFKEVVPEDCWLPFVASRKEYPIFFRNKIRFSFIREGDHVSPSRHSKGSTNSDIPVDTCFLESELATQLMLYTAEVATQLFWNLYDPHIHAGWLKHLLIREGKETGQCMVGLVTAMGKEEEVQVWAKGIQKKFPQVVSGYHITSSGKNSEANKLTPHLLFGTPHIQEKVGEFTFAISPLSFFQTNGSMVKILYDTIRDTVQKHSPTQLWDLYAGSATIGIYHHKTALSVISVESNPANILDAQLNTETNQIHNLEVIEGSVDEVITSSFVKEKGMADVVIVDPPRAGLSNTIKGILPNLPSHYLVYVSCNPATCYRDTQELLRRGYTIQSARGIDMFPHTWHSEMVIEFRK